MNKCPICDIPFNIGRHSTYCPRCGKLKTYLEKEYQQRLDKALSKFENAGDYLCYANMICYDKEKFSIEYDYKHILLSLDTVESLIKDLESE